MWPEFTQMFVDLLQLEGYMSRWKFAQMHIWKESLILHKVLLFSFLNTV